jgi:hypothetical protein
MFVSTENFAARTVISGFRRDVNEICALLGCYAASCGNCLPKFRDSWPLKMGPIRCPETSVNNYHTTLRNITEERWSFLCCMKFFLIEGPRSRCCGRTTALKAYCATRWGFFWFSVFMKYRWNEIDRVKPKYSEKNLSQYHFVHHKSHMHWVGMEPGPPRWEAGD